MKKQDKKRNFLRACRDKAGAEYCDHKHRSQRAAIRCAHRNGYQYVLDSSGRVRGECLWLDEPFRISHFYGPWPG